MLKIIRTILFITPLFFCACDSSSPFVPEDLPDNELAYFPMEKGYGATYDFSYEYAQNPRHTLETIRHSINGLFSLEVTDVLIKEKEGSYVVFYKVETSFNIDKESYIKYPWDWKTSEDPDSFFSRENFELTKDHFLVFENNFLWYADSAASFEQLDESALSPMMKAPIATGGDIYLKLFQYPVAISEDSRIMNFERPIEFSRVYADSSARYLHNYYDATADYSQQYELRIFKGKGITVLRGFFTKHPLGTTSYIWRSNFSFNLIE